jgi:lipopolysaccharide export system protein LptC
MTKVSDSADWPPDSPRGGPKGSRSGRPIEGRPSDRLDLTTSPWRGAHKAAGLHSARVRFLRWAMLGGAAVAIALILGLVLFDPFRRLPRNVSIGEVSVQGTRVTVASPKISGFQTDGRPYEVKASAGVQDTTTPSILELIDIDARIGMMDASTVQVTAAHGLYDGTQQKMVLNGKVRIWNKIGYDIRATKTTIDFQGGALGSDEPVNVILNGGTVSANQMDIRDNGHKISFEGAVKSLIEQASGGTTEPADAPAGREQ